MTINIENFNNILQVHAYIASQLNFPGYYGSNLDALYDMLSSQITYTEIKINGLDKANGKLADDMNEMIDMFECLQEENSNFKCYIDGYEL